MGVTLQQLLTPSTEDQSLATLLSILDGLGFSATSWESGDIARTIVQMTAKLHSSFTTQIASIAAGRFNDTAFGGWLDLLSTSHYDNTRTAATTSRANGLLDDAAGVGPFTIAIGDLVAKDPSGKTYRNTTGGTLLNSGMLTLLFEAEVPGKASFPSSLELVTTLAGVTLSVVLPIVRIGADAESDPKLQTRNRTKWATLAYAGPAEAYVQWALSADPLVTRAYVDDLNPRGPGTINLYIAGASGALPSGVATNVSNYIEGVTDGISRRPLTADVEVLSASNATVMVAGTVFFAPSYTSANILALVQQAIEDMFESLPVGGAGGKVTLAAIYLAAMQVQGVVNVNLTLPSADVTVSATQVPVPSFSLVAMAVI